MIKGKNDFMKNIKKYISLILTVLITLSLFTLTACGSGEKTYKVTVKDAVGNPYNSGIVVRFMQGDKQIAMQSCDENGIATKTLPSGRYNIALSFAGEVTDYFYDKDIKVTASKTEVDVILAYKASSNAEKLYVGSNEYDAYSINAGCTYVELKPDSRNYFLFTPKEAGNYEFSVAGESNAAIGYYGAPHFVQENSAAEVKDNKFTMNITSSMIGTTDTGTTVIVIGVDSKKSTKDCVVCINRLGDPIKTIEDEPWTVYQKTVELQDYKLPANYEIKEFDLTASSDSYKLVLNKEDGYYHLYSENGPLVLVRLAEDCEYIACFKTMLDRSGVVKYFFDKDKNLEKKESYSECLLEYIKLVDENEGVYPLNKDLEYIIKSRGEYASWWDAENSGYIFKDADGNLIPGINAEIAWLLMCCYIG